MAIYSDTVLTPCRSLPLHLGQQAQDQWHIRHMMRHLVEVMLVLEGKQPWARALGE